MRLVILGCAMIAAYLLKAPQYIYWTLCAATAIGIVHHLYVTFKLVKEANNQ